jgi:hypothetical protein
MTIYIAIAAKRNSTENIITYIESMLSMNVYVKSKYLVYFYLFNMCLSVFLLLNNSLTVINKKKIEL